MTIASRILQNRAAHRRRPIRALLGLCLIAASLSGRAAVIHDESMDGDLSNGPEPVLTFNLTLGSNEIKGDIGGGDPVDKFEFVVPADLLLIELNFETFAPGLDLYTIDPITSFDLPTVIGPGTPLMGDLLETPPSSGPPLGPLGGGLYGMEMKADANDPPWTLDFIVVQAPVPEPLTAVMLLSGLAAMRIVSRRAR